MVHRLHNRNTGYTENPINNLANNQATLNATEGATALNLNHEVVKNTKVIENQVEQKKEESLHETSQDSSFENISLESATYLQNTQENNENSEISSDLKDETPNFEVDSIELATPQLFDDEHNSQIDQKDSDNSSELFGEPNKEKTLKSDNKTELVKEPEMFDEPRLEEDFEIPAFLRKQKN